MVTIWLLLRWLQHLSSQDLHCMCWKEISTEDSFHRLEFYFSLRLWSHLHSHQPRRSQGVGASKHIYLIRFIINGLERHCGLERQPGLLYDSSLGCISVRFFRWVFRGIPFFLLLLLLRIEFQMHCHDLELLGVPACKPSSWTVKVLPSKLISTMFSSEGAKDQWEVWKSKLIDKILKLFCFRDFREVFRINALHYLSTAGQLGVSWPE